LTDVTDTNYEILMKLDPESLFNACATNQYAYALCQAEFFWINRLIQDFGEDILQYKPLEESFQQQYRYLVSVYPDELSIRLAKKIDTLTGMRTVMTWLQNEGF